MLIVKDIYGNEEGFVGYKGLKRNRTKNGEKTLAFLAVPDENNEHSYPLLQNESTVEFDGDTFRIKQLKEKSKGKVTFKEVVAIHTFFDLIDEHIYEVHNGSMTFANAAQFVLGPFGYTWDIIGTFYAQDWENFGDDNPIALFQEMMKRYKAEFTLKGTHITFKNKIGNSTDFQLRYNYNIKSIEKNGDSSNFSTYIRGFGKDGLVAEYISPLDEANGGPFKRKHAKPVRDEKYTTHAGLMERLQSEIPSTISFSVTVDFLDLRRAGYPYDVPNEGDDMFVIHEPMNMDLEARIMEINEEFTEGNPYPIKTNVTIANYRNNMTDKFIEYSRTSKTVNDIVEGNRKLPYNVLDDAVKRATEALQSAQTELEFENGIIARSKTNPNHLVLLNSSGIGISSDGGQTFREAITADGFVLTAGVIGSLDANVIQSGVIQTRYLDVRDITNLVYNSNFEQGTTGWGTGNTIVNDPGHSQTIGGKVVSQSQRDAYFGDDFPVTEGEQFHVGCWAFGGWSQISFNMGIRFMDRNGNYKWVPGPGWLPGSGWSRKESTVTAPPGSVYGHVWFQIASFENFGTWLYDRAFVRRVGLITFDKAEGGAIKLGEAYGDGQLHVYNSGGNIVGRIDTNGGYFPRIQADNIIGNVVNKWWDYNMTWWVDFDNGNDSNTGGSSSSPKRSLQSLLDSLPKDLNGKFHHFKCRGTLHAGFTVTGFRNGHILITEWDSANLPTIKGQIWCSYNDRVMLQSLIVHGVVGNGAAMVHSSFDGEFYAYAVKCYGANISSNGFWIEGSNFRIGECHAYNMNSRGLCAFNNAKGHMWNTHGNPSVAVYASTGAIVQGWGCRWGGVVTRDALCYVGGYNEAGTQWHNDIWNTYPIGNGIDYGEATPPAPPPPTEQTLSVTAGTGDNYSTSGYWTNDEVKQGNWGYGDRYGLWYFDLSAVKGKTIISATISVSRGSGGNSGARTIYFRTHNYTSRGSRPAGAPAMSAVGATGSLAVGGSGTFDITSMIQNHIAGGVDMSIGVYTTGQNDYMSLGIYPTVTIKYK